jgi:hypothetical protein
MNHRTFRWLSLPLLLILALAGCDNPVGSGGGHPEGLVITNQQGAEVATYLYPTRTSTGRVVVSAGAESNFRVHLLARDGSRIELDGLEYSIGTVHLVIPSLADVTFTGTDQLRIVGRVGAATTSTLRLQVNHGNHEEFVAEIRLDVE